MHCSRMEDWVEAFVELGMLVVEGRIPAEGTARGYREGPHCPLPPQGGSGQLLSQHHCDPAEFMCMRYERLRKHMSLLCNNAVPMCVEVLLCPVCPCGTERAQSPEVANVPSPTDLLLEQWTVSVVHLSGEPCNMSVRGLFQAVRSQLHFSQLSAWWSCSKGVCPPNVCYRLTTPEEAFATQFSRPPLQHTFPPAAVGPNTQLKVGVRMLPRTSAVPPVLCAACTPETSVRKRSVGLEQPLQLGESLLDPPGPGPSSSSSRAHAGMCKWHTGSPPSPPRRRPSRQVMARRCDKHSYTPRQILPLPGPVDDRMQTNCNKHGKHDCRCEDEGDESHNQLEAVTNKLNLDLSKKEMEEVLTVLRVRTDPENITIPAEKKTGKGDLLLSAILRSNQPQPDALPKRKPESLTDDITSVTNPDAKSSCDIFSKSVDLVPPDKPVETAKTFPSVLSKPPFQEKSPDSKNTPCVNDRLVSNLSNNPTQEEPKGVDPFHCSVVDKLRTNQPLTDVNKCQEDLSDNVVVDDCSTSDLSNRVEAPSGKDVPTALDKAKFRRSLDSAASMVFHWRTGLPLTSSPAPLRRASQRFDFDSTITSVSAIRSALFDSESDDTESECSKSPSSPQIDVPLKEEPWGFHNHSSGSALLGSFEESVLNGRLEPVSTVHGFTADLGASGSFCPPHLTLPVTVFFYTLGDNDKVSTPYLAHINLGKKGYVVPRCGTIQVTLLNPLGTVIKMFVVVYNLSDMPNNSCTFLRQRTLYLPTDLVEPPESTQKYLRYLIHLRFASSKSGRLFLHTDIRMIIFRKSDLDTATGHGVDLAYELRSYTHSPTNPKFSPRK